MTFPTNTRSKLTPIRYDLKKIQLHCGSFQDPRLRDSITQDTKVIFYNNAEKSFSDKSTCGTSKVTPDHTVAGFLPDLQEGAVILTLDELPLAPCVDSVHQCLVRHGGTDIEQLSFYRREVFRFTCDEPLLSWKTGTFCVYKYVRLPGSGTFLCPYVRSNCQNAVQSTPIQAQTNIDGQVVCRQWCPDCETEPMSTRHTKRVTDITIKLDETTKYPVKAFL